MDTRQYMSRVGRAAASTLLDTPCVAIVSIAVVLLMVPSFTRKHRRRIVGADPPLDRMLLHLVSVFGPRA